MEPIVFLNKIRHLPAALQLRLKVERLRVFLRAQGIHTNILTQYRRSEIAHRWSTSYSIISGHVSVGELAKLKNGSDLDGNLWYRPEWRVGISDEESADKCPELVKNARQLGPHKCVYAEEGYTAKSPRRKPNIMTIPISKHVYGLAVDMNVDWLKLNGPWSEESIQVIKRFGLSRPKNDERWHFERLSTKCGEV